MVLRKGVFALILFLSCHVSWAAYTVLIDPGHGGSDDGATNRSFLYRGKKVQVLEKNLSLAISKKIFKLLQKKNYQVYLTRSVDRDVSLQDRASMAEKIKADLLVSVHINSSKMAYSNGFETFYVDNKSDAAAKKVEEVENKYLDGEELLIQQILAGLIVERMAPDSRRLALSIHKYVAPILKKQFKMRDRGVKAGLFYVLALSKRPSVLLEAGFLSNPKDTKKLLSEKFQWAYARAVAQGIDQFMIKMRKSKVSLF